MRVGKTGRAYPVKSLEERFREKFVQGSVEECWEWLASKNGAGYGQINTCPPHIPSGKMIAAHRLALILATGKEGEVAMHLCDNPGCVNPNHLRWGTTLENVADRTTKGRSGNPGAKLTAKQVKEIRETFTGDYKELSERFGVDRLTLWRIITRRSWKNI